VYVYVCVLFVEKVGGVHSPLALFVCAFLYVCVCYSLKRWEVCTHHSFLCVCVGLYVCVRVCVVSFVCVCVIRCKGGRCALTSSLGCVYVLVCMCLCVCYSLKRWEVCTHL